MTIFVEVKLVGFDGDGADNISFAEASSCPLVVSSANPWDRTNCRLFCRLSPRKNRPWSISTRYVSCLKWTSYAAVPTQALVALPFPEDLLLPRLEGRQKSNEADRCRSKLISGRNRSMRSLRQDSQVTRDSPRKERNQALPSRCKR